MTFRLAAWYSETRIKWIFHSIVRDIFQLRIVYSHTYATSITLILLYFPHFRSPRDLIYRPYIHVHLYTLYLLSLSTLTIFVLRREHPANCLQIQTSHITNTPTLYRTYQTTKPSFLAIFIQFSNFLLFFFFSPYFIYRFTVYTEPNSADDSSRFLFNNFLYFFFTLFFKVDH